MDAGVDRVHVHIPNGVWKTPIYDGDELLVSLSERIVGRCPSEDVTNPLNPSEVIVKAGVLIDEIAAKRAKGEWTVPTTLKRELATNPFLRASAS